MPYKIELINEKSFVIEEGQTLLQASLNAGVQHYHVCGGKAKCSTCRVVVHKGMDFLSPPNEKEIKLRELKHFPDNVRLACQTKVQGGDVIIQRIIKDDTDLDLYITGVHCDDRQGIGEEKELALMFLDIRDFTPFIEQHLPFDVIHIIRRLSILYNDVIESYNGKIVEFMGDGFYALFGLNESIEEAMNNAVKAGREIMDKVKELNKSYFEKFFEKEIVIGVGLHAGKVIVGESGIGNKSSLTAMGFPVNIAARLETATKELNNNFIVSEYVYGMLNEHKNSYEQKQINLKGVSEPFNVRLLGERFR